ncbi:MAG: hypothetical protein EON57_06775 [Alphaproteobacteria bacterium]|nr:MAG: hypothetical protein EON57_06775 [Alphaproteobacteria bacterium]
MLATSLFLLSACGGTPPLTTADYRRIDHAMERVKIEQDRTDRVLAQAQAYRMSNGSLPGESEQDIAPPT